MHTNLKNNKSPGIQELCAIFHQSINRAKVETYAMLSRFIYYDTPMLLTFSKQGWICEISRQHLVIRPPKQLKFILILPTPVATNKFQMQSPLDTFDIL